MTPEQRARVLDVAQSQIGVREDTGRNDGVPASRYADGRREPWCADYVIWVYETAGLSLPGDRRLLPWVQYLEDQMRQHAYWAPSCDVYPETGDIIFFRARGKSDRGRGRHCGIVEWCDNILEVVGTIEGNTRNCVARRQYPLSSRRITGYGWL